MNYRKATFKDISSISSLITNLLGTCNLESNKTILESNIEEVSKSINNYYVCTVNSKVVGACGISNTQKQDTYNLKLKNVKEILYLVVDKKYQGNGIGTRLLNLCSHNCKNDIIYEAWGDNGKYPNSKIVLERCGYEFYQDLGKDYYKKHNYCSRCVNRNKECNECIAQIWIKHKSI